MVARGIEPSDSPEEVPVAPVVALLVGAVCLRVLHRSPMRVREVA